MYVQLLHPKSAATIVNAHVRDGYRAMVDLKNRLVTVINAQEYGNTLLVTIANTAIHTPARLVYLEGVGVIVVVTDPNVVTSDRE